ncbi:MAG: branched-chain amino acid ABC transporter ATP-binding protein, partial [Nitrospinota bacterium]
LMASPKLLLVDEVSMGLMPILVNSVFQTLRRLNEEGMTILIVEQNARKTLEIVDRGYVLERGRLTVAGTAEELRREAAIQRAYLGG